MFCLRIGMSFIGARNISSHAHNTGSWFLLEFLSKIPDEQPPSFIIMGIPLGYSTVPDAQTASTVPVGDLFMGYGYEQQQQQQMFPPSALKRNNRPLLENQSHLLK